MKKGTIFNFVLIFVGALFLSTFLTSCNKKRKSSEESLKVYAIIHEEETKALLELFTKETGIKAIFAHSTTGEIINKIIAEKNNPQADIVLGGASSYHMILDENGALENYKSPLVSDFPSFALSPNNTWTGFCILALGIGVNEKRYKEKFPSIPIPRSWDDLLRKEYKGEIVLTNPLSSSTAYLFLQNQLQRLGNEKGWEYLLSLAGLVGTFPSSGSAPSRLVGSGEYALCISYLHAISKYASQGFNVRSIPVSKAVGDVDCVAILKNTKMKKAAEKFVDFILSPSAQELMSKICFTTPVNPHAVPPKGCIKTQELDLIDYDTNKAFLEKDDVLKKWSLNVK